MNNFVCFSFSSKSCRSVIIEETPVPIPDSLWKESLVLRKICGEWNGVSGTIKGVDLQTFKELCNLFQCGKTPFSEELEAMLDYFDLSKAVVHRSMEKDLEAVCVPGEIQSYPFRQELVPNLSRYPGLTMANARHVCYSSTPVFNVVQKFSIADRKEYYFEDLRPLHYITDFWIIFDSQNHISNLSSIELTIKDRQRKIVWQELITGAHISHTKHNRTCFTVPFSRCSQQNIILLFDSKWTISVSLEWKGIPIGASIYFGGFICGPEEWDAIMIQERSSPLENLFGSDVGPVTWTHTESFPITLSNFSDHLTTTSFCIDESVVTMQGFSLIVLFENLSVKGAVKFITAKKDGETVCSFPAILFESENHTYDYTIAPNIPFVTWHGINTKNFIFEIQTVNHPGTISIIKRGTNHVTDKIRERNEMSMDLRGPTGQRGARGPAVFTESRGPRNPSRHHRTRYTGD